jgi:hypothetical protein
MSRPRWVDLAVYMAGSFRYAKMLVLVAVGFYAAPLVLLSRARPRASAEGPARVAGPGPAGEPGPVAVGLVLLCLVSFLMPIAIWTESRVGIRVFLGRYLLPSFVVWPCALGLVLERLAVVSRSDGPRVGGGAGWLVRAAPAAACGAVAALAVSFGLNHNQSDLLEISKIRSMKHIAEAIRVRELDFVTHDAHVFLPVWNYGGRSAERMRYVPLAEKFGGKTDNKIFGALERHFWPGVILTQERLRSRRMRCLMLAEEREMWIERGTISEEFRVVEDLGEGLFVVEG